MKQNEIGGVWQSAVRIRVVLLLVLAAWSIHAQDGAERSKPSESDGFEALVTRGALAEERGHWEQALGFYREALADFDEKRALAGKTLLRLANRYERLGAVESAEAAYQRLRDEFGDLRSLTDQIPEKYGLQRRAPKRGDDSGLMADGGVGQGTGRMPDPETAISELTLGYQMRRVELLSQKVEEALELKNQARVRVEVFHESDLLALPDSLEPGEQYLVLRRVYRMAKMSPVPLEGSPTEEQAKKGLLDWVKSVVQPEIEADYNAAERKHQEWSKIHEEALAEYRKKLEEAQERASLRRSVEQGNAQVYQIRSGDSLTAIATRLQTSVEELMRLNPDLQDRALRVGKRIAIPSKALAQPARFSIVGAVQSPGYYELPSNRIGILEAIALAGGFTGIANERQVDVIREGATKKISVIAEEKDANPKDRFRVQDGDVIRVKERFF